MLDPGATLLEPGEGIGIDRVEVADDQVDLEPEGEGVLGAAVGGDDELACRQVGQPGGRGAAGDDEGVPCAHPGTTRTVHRPSSLLSRRSRP